MEQERGGIGVDTLIGSLWNIQSFVFSPVDLGIPASRTRRYTICMLQNSAKLLPEASFEQAFSAPRVAGCEVYLDSSVLQPGAPGIDLTQSSADMARLEGWQVMCAKKGACDVGLPAVERTL